MDPRTSSFTTQTTCPNKHNSLLGNPRSDFGRGPQCRIADLHLLSFFPTSQPSRVETSVGYASRLQNAPVCRTNDDAVIGGVLASILCRSWGPLVGVWIVSSSVAWKDGRGICQQTLLQKPLSGHICDRNWRRDLRHRGRRAESPKGIPGKAGLTKCLHRKSEEPYAVFRGCMLAANTYLMYAKPHELFVSSTGRYSLFKTIGGHYMKGIVHPMSWTVCSTRVESRQTFLSRLFSAAVPLVFITIIFTKNIATPMYQGAGQGSES